MRPGMREPPSEPSPAELAQVYADSPKGQPAAGGANARTISAYDQHAQRYIDRTAREVAGASKDWLDRALAGVACDARILELGSASGRDAAYLQGLGYRVRCTDATPAFVAALRSRGIAASALNAITDDLPDGLDVVLANAVLLHFTRPEFAAVADKVRRALRPGGRFACTLKLGDGQEWSSDKLDAPRFFCYWREQRLRDALGAAGFTDIDIREAPGRAGDKDWLHVLATR
jgi:SAM-dependent methyltransferase